jgi:hypothetical protein
VGTTQPPMQWVVGAPSPQVKRQGREADHSPPSSADVKNGGIILILPLPHVSSRPCNDLFPLDEHISLQHDQPLYFNISLSLAI